MKLDAEAARRGIADKIAKPLKLDTVAAAQAIVDIAVNKMSLAVREVSVAKGYDPRDFALVASGGAGPLHVCAIARELYIPTVIVPLFPSHFSAFGMLLADERHDFTRTVYSDLANVDFAKLVKVHDEMVAEAKGALRHAKSAEHQIHLDIRYVGQEFTLQVPVELTQLKTGDRKAHPHRVRQALRAPLRAPFAGRAGGDGQHPARRHRQAHQAGVPVSGVRRRSGAGRRERGLFHLGEQAAQGQGLSPRRARRRRRDRRAGADPGARHHHGAVRERPLQGRRVRRIDHLNRSRGMKLDTVTLEVIRNALPAVANEMAADLQRTSYNMMIYEVRDYCTALLNTKGELISQNVGGVSHFVADLGVLVTDGMQRYGADGFKPGDVIITNHQAVAGQHLNNIVIYMPYFYKGELLMFLMVRAHWIDVGGTSTGFGAGATVADPWLEGLQLDQLKIYEEGKLNEPLYRVIKDNIRFPESSLGDMKSQMAACRLGGRRLDELFEKYGRDTLLAAIERIFDETEQKCRNVVSQLARRRL